MENNSSAGPGKDLQKAYRVAYLVAGFIREQLTSVERDELDQWILASDDNMQLFGELIDEKNLAKSLATFDRMNVEHKLAASKEGRSFQEKRLVVSNWWLAAAAVLLLLAGIFWMMNEAKTNDPELQIANSVEQDISPGFSHAVLLLDNGRQIVLEGGNADTLLSKGLEWHRAAGKLVYGAVETGKPVEMHQLIVPRKGTYTAILPDGTIVRLNAESSLRYPTVFSGQDRTVELTGEAYFEVAKNAAMPFKVAVGGLLVEAIGTSFNIHAYSNDDFLRTSLVEGVVRIQAGNNVKVLHPGDMAEWKNEVLTIARFNREEELAWTDNNFVFRNAPIADIMKQVQRWYDAEPVYVDSISFHLNATIKRDLPVSKVLDLLEQTGHAHFKIKDKRIIISK